MVNPEIIQHSAAKIKANERSVSFSGITVPIRRSQSIIVKYLYTT